MTPVCDAPVAAVGLSALFAVEDPDADNQGEGRNGKNCTAANGFNGQPGGLSDGRAKGDTEDEAQAAPYRYHDAGASNRARDKTGQRNGVSAYVQGNPPFVFSGGPRNDTTCCNSGVGESRYSFASLAIYMP